ncbi:MAG: hypothetical protein O2897_05015, partial [bacterium]|nr:hypothetical protein [bacterium]
MKNKLILMFKQIGSISPLALSFLLVQSCDVTPDINQVKKGYLEKSQVEGEWLISSQVVDKPVNNASIFIGMQCGVDRGRFEITEDKLLVYRAYEKVPGTEGKNYGEQTLIAAFPIIKHFDIRRKYNDVNGVENNVIIENDVDRPWQERKNMRVDWSNNLVSDSECNEWIKTNTALQLPSSSNQMRDPYRVRISEDYMETTINAFAKPNANVCNYIGDWNCAGAQVKIKFSFLKVKPNDYEKGSYPDYLPLEYGKNKSKQLCAKGEKDCENIKALWLSQTSAGTEICDPSRHNIDDCKQYQIPVFSRFGYFRTERFYYDREKDFTLSGREQLINRWNIWQQSKTADGSVLPINDRIPKPIVYYLNVEFPVELFEASQTIASEWNIAFSQTVAALKSECSISSYNNYVAQNKLKSEMLSLGFKVATEANIKDACYELG